MATTEVVIFAFIFELFGAIFLFLIGTIVYRRFLEFRQKATLFLAAAVLIVGISIFISSLGRLIALLEGITVLYHGFQYTPFVWIALALALNVVGDIFFLLFSNQVFFKGSKKVTVFAIALGGIITALVFILVPTPELTTGEPTQSYIDLFQMIWLLQALFTFLTGGIITYGALRDARKGGTVIERRGLQILSLTGISLAITNIMFIIDEQLTPYFGGNFSLFYYIGWIIAHTGVFCAYLGFILPDWLRKRWE